MSNTTVVRTRISENLKNEAASVLAAMGLTVSDFLRIGLTKVAHEKTLPFDMHVPNTLTAETLTKSEHGEDVHSFANADAMFKDLGI